MGSSMRLVWAGLMAMVSSPGPGGATRLAVGSVRLGCV